MFTLKDLSFEVETATFMGCIYDPYPYEHRWTLGWSIDIGMKEREVDGEIWSPRLYHESLRFATRRWADIAGQILTWDSAFDTATDEPNGSLYIFEHEDIPRATLRFLERNGRDFKIDWTGVCNVFWDENYGENVPFSVKTSVTFDYVQVNGRVQDNDATLLQRLALFLDPSDFAQQPIQSGGLDMMYSIFEPK